MKLASLKSGGRDGSLVVVSKDLTRMASAASVAQTLQQAIETWESSASALKKISELVEQNEIETMAYDVDQLASPLPRSYQHNLQQSIPLVKI